MEPVFAGQKGSSNCTNTFSSMSKPIVSSAIRLSCGRAGVKNVS